MPTTTYPSNATMLQGLVGKTIQFNLGVEKTELDFDSGMKAVIKNIHVDADGACFSMMVDFKEFEEHNKQFMQTNYWDKNGKATLKWNETNYYPKDCMSKDWYDWSVPCFDVLEG